MSGANRRVRPSPLRSRRQMRSKVGEVGRVRRPACRHDLVKDPGKGGRRKSWVGDSDCGVTLRKLGKADEKSSGHHESSEQPHTSPGQPGTPTPFSHQHAAARETNSSGFQNAAAAGAHSHTQAVHSETQGVFSPWSQSTSHSQLPEKFLPVSPGPLF